MEYILLSIIIVILIICITIYNCKKQVLISKRPQSNCHHDMTIMKTFDGTSSNEFLSTCKKCGYQKRHIFSGLNS